MSYAALFSPIKIRGLELRNRVILPGMNTKMVKNKHHVSEDVCAYHAARAAGGCGLNMVEPVAICPQTHASLYFGLYTEEHVEGMKKITKAIHDAGGKAGVQLWHGGLVPQHFFDETNKIETPQNLSVDDIHRIIKEYGAAAEKAVRAGFDVLEFHAAHTYLPHEFLNPYFNNRTDEYGGSFLNRVRFPLECIREIRKNMPEDMPLFMRVDAKDELLKKNMSDEEIVEFINMAADEGVDIADLSRGNSFSNATVYLVPPYNLEPGFNREIMGGVKSKVKIPVVGVGRLTHAALANELIEDGTVDMVAVGRAQLADPEWCNKSMEGRDEEIRRCIGCTQGCYDKVIDSESKHITCNRNPRLCLEYLGMPKTESPKKVMVIGGGVGGLMCAEYLKQRGHRPIVYEATDTLGGNFIVAGKAPGKGEFEDAAHWEGREAKRLGVEIKTGVKVTAEMIEKEKPDHVVIASGADFVMPNIPGAEGKDVVLGYDVLAGKAKAQGSTIIIGGGGVGVEVAQLLYKEGLRDIRVIDREKVCNGLGMLRNMYFNLTYSPEDIKRSNRCTIKTIGDHKISYSYINKDKKEAVKTRHFDTLVIAVGAKHKPTSEFTDKCQELGIPYDVIGDAKAPRMAIDAAEDAFKTAMEI